MIPKIIGIVGPIRAGKTTVTEHLRRQFGYVSASNSDVLKRILEGMKLPPTRSNLAALGDSIFKVLGNDVIAKYRLENIEAGPMVVDGIRYLDELKRYLKEPSFKLLAVTADPLIRFDRARRMASEIKDLDISRVEFDLLAESRSELSVPELLLKADETIINSGTVKDLELKIDTILKNWSGQNFI